MFKTIVVSIGVILTLAASVAFSYQDLTVVYKDDPTVIQISKLEACFKYPKGSTNQYLCVKDIMDKVAPKSLPEKVVMFNPVIVPPIKHTMGTR